MLILSSLWLKVGFPILFSEKFIYLRRKQLQFSANHHQYGFYSVNRHGCSVRFFHFFSSTWSVLFLIFYFYTSYFNLLLCVNLLKQPCNYWWILGRLTVIPLGYIFILLTEKLFKLSNSKKFFVGFFAAERNEIDRFSSFLILSSMLLLTIFKLFFLA